MNQIKLTSGISLEIHLTDYDLERIANGYDLVLKTSQPSNLEKIVLRISQVCNWTNSTINYDKKIISGVTLAARDAAKKINELFRGGAQ